MVRHDPLRPRQSQPGATKEAVVHAPQTARARSRTSLSTEHGALSHAAIGCAITGMPAPGGAAALLAGDLARGLQGGAGKGEHCGQIVVPELPAVVVPSLDHQRRRDIVLLERLVEPHRGDVETVLVAAA